MQHVGGDIAGDKVQGVSDGAGIIHSIRPPGLFKVKIAAVDGVQVGVKSAGGAGGSGTGLSSYDIIKVAAVVAVGDEGGKRVDIVVVALFTVPFNLYAEAFLGLHVPVVNCFFDD